MVIWEVQPVQGWAVEINLYACMKSVLFKLFNIGCITFYPRKCYKLYIIIMNAYCKDNMLTCSYAHCYEINESLRIMNQHLQQGHILMP